MEKNLPNEDDLSKQNENPEKDWMKDEPPLPEFPSEPSSELWPFPEPMPVLVERIMPHEEAVKLVFEIFGRTIKEDWSMERARGMVNRVRMEKFHLFKTGYYERHPELLIREDNQ